VVALALSAYLGWHSVAGGTVIGCGGGSPCEKVLSSRWSTVGGVLPVSGLAAGAYLAVLAASFFVGPATPAPVRQLAWRAMLVLVGAAAGSAVWFSIVQKWIIGAFCPNCMATHLTSLLLAALVIWRAPKRFDNALTEPALRRPGPSGAWALLGLVPAGLLALSQIVLTPPAVYRGGVSQKNLADISPHAVPLAGSPDAAWVVTLLFDYQCPHCQQLHFMLPEVIRGYGGKLAFALRPVPLERQCNPYIPRDVDAFKGSCELARIGLAVWLAKRKAFPAFELWMFSLESGDRWRPRSADAARAKAVELVGQATFDAALADPWIAGYLQTSVQIFGDTGSNAIPKLVYGSRWVIPQPQDAGQLAAILEGSLGVPKP
jgi:uncharacterized membrane protein